MAAAVFVLSQFVREAGGVLRFRAGAVGPLGGAIAMLNPVPSTVAERASGEGVGSGRGAIGLVEFGASSLWRTFSPSEIWRFRELIVMLVVRDLTVRYRQAMIGVAWVLAQPLATTTTIALLLPSIGSGKAAYGVPFPIFVLQGIVLYGLFNSIVSSGTQTLVYNHNLVTKIYFPRIVLLIVNLATALCDFAVAAIMLAVAMAIYQTPVSWLTLGAPAFVLLAVLCGLAIALWTSALNAIYRDTGLAVPFLLQLGMFASPVMYATQEVAASRYRLLLECNAMSLAINGFRYTLSGVGGVTLREAIVGVTSLLVVLLSGLWYFNRVERYLADRI